MIGLVVVGRRMVMNWDDETKDIREREHDDATWGRENVCYESSVRE